MALRVSRVELPLLNSFLPEAKINNDSDQECLIDDETDDRETDDEENDENGDVDLRAPLRRNIILADVVEQQRATAE